MQQTRNSKRRQKAEDRKVGGREAGRQATMLTNDEKHTYRMERGRGAEMQKHRKGREGREGRKAETGRQTSKTHASRQAG